MMVLFYYFCMFLTAPHSLLLWEKTLHIITRQSYSHSEFVFCISPWKVPFISLLLSLYFFWIVKKPNQVLLNLCDTSSYLHVFHCMDCLYFPSPSPRWRTNPPPQKSQPITHLAASSNYSGVPWLQLNRTTMRSASSLIWSFWIIYLFS